MPEAPAYRVVWAILGALLGLAFGGGLVVARPPPREQSVVKGAARPLGGATATPTCGPPGFTSWTLGQPVPTGVRLMSLASDGTSAYAAGGYGPLNQWARYDPAANTWTVLPPLPVAAEGPTAVYAPNTGHLYVFGGTSGNTVLTTTQIYDPATAQWSRGAPLPAPRASMTSGYWNGQIYLAAGTNSVQFAPQIQVWAYDPLLDRWNTSLLSLPAATVGAAGGIIDGQLLLAGGADNQAQPLSWLLYYDLATQQRGFRADLPLPVYGAGSAVVNGQLWVFGGGQPFAGLTGVPRLDRVTPHALTVSEIYDPVTNNWVAGPPLNIARALTAGTAVGNQVLAVGGQGSGGDLDSVEVASSIPSTRCPTSTPTVTSTPAPATPTTTPTATPCDNWGMIDPWTMGPSAPPPVSGVGVTSDGASVVIAGGNTGGAQASIKRVARYDPTTATWQPLASLAISTAYASLIYAPNVHTFYSFGGLYLSNIAETWVQRYDPMTPTWEFAPQAMPDRRAYLGTAYDNGRIYIVGGTVGNVFVPHDNLWAYDPVADTWDTTLSPIPMSTMGAVTGVIRRHLLVAGGIHGGQDPSTTLYDYDIAAGTWYTRTPLLQPVFEAAGAVVGGRLWVMGGGTPFAGTAPSVPQALTTVQIYDPVTDSWSWGPPLPAPRSHGGGTQVGDTAFVFAGSGNADLLYTQFHPGLPCPTRTPSVTETATRTATRTRPPATPTATPCGVTFTDVPPGSTFYGYVRCLVCQGIVGGYPCGGPSEPCPGSYYRPNNNVTRGQVAKIVSSSANLTEPVPSSQQTFADSPPSSTFWVWIERLAGRGIIGGYACGGPSEPCLAPENRPYFRPNTPVTRGQLSKIVTGAAGWTETPTGQTFADVPFGSTFYLYIERVAVRGIVGGYPCGGAGEPCVAPTNRPYFRPSTNATRGQMSKIAAAAFFPNCPIPTSR